MIKDNNNNNSKNKDNVTKSSNTANTEIISEKQIKNKLNGVFNNVKMSQIIQVSNMKLNEASTNLKSLDNNIGLSKHFIFLS